MNIKTEYFPQLKEWQAWDEDKVDYDFVGNGFVPCFPIGSGTTEQEALDDLKDKQQ